MSDAPATGLDHLVAAINCNRDCDLRDSTALYEQCRAAGIWKPLIAELEERGVLLLRSVLPSSQVSAAHAVVIEQLGRDAARLSAEQGKSAAARDLIVDAATGEEIKIAGASTAPLDASSWKAVGCDSHLQALSRGPALQELFAGLSPYTAGGFLQLPGATWLHSISSDDTPPRSDHLHFRHHKPEIFGDPFRPRWSVDPEEFCLRVMDYRHHGECDQCSDVQLDHYTCWIPLHETDSDSSVLNIRPDSQLYEGSRGKVDAEELQPSGSESAAAGTAKVTLAPPWQAPSHLKAGDVIIYNLRTIYKHSSSTSNSRASSSISSSTSSSSSPSHACTISLAIRVKLNHMPEDKVPAPSRDSCSKS